MLSLARTLDVLKCCMEDVPTITHMQTPGYRFLELTDWRKHSGEEASESATAPSDGAALSPVQSNLAVRVSSSACTLGVSCGSMQMQLWKSVRTVQLRVHCFHCPCPPLEGLVNLDPMLFCSWIDYANRNLLIPYQGSARRALAPMHWGER